MVCKLCNNSINIINRHQIENGYICHKCFKLYPSFIKVNTYSDTKLILLSQYFKDNKKKKYITTASYGVLGIDEINGVFQISENGIDYRFDCLDMEDGHILCTNPKADKYNHVFCDVEFYYVSSMIEFKILIKKNIKCKCTNINNNQIKWEEPGDMIMFKSMFLNMLQTSEKKYAERYEKAIITKHDIDMLKAKALYMVNDGDYTISEINETKRNLLKIYHPDEESGDLEKAKTILFYYELLKKEKEETDI